MMSFAIILLFSSCDVKPRALQTGKDNCDYCQMTLSDVRFGAELITQKGKIYVFDDPHCVISFIKEKKVDKSEIKDVYLTDYSGSHELVKINIAHLYRSDDLRSPMGGNIAAFENNDSLIKLMVAMKGERVIWDDLVK
jgi:copper chaperone NosL